MIRVRIDESITRHNISLKFIPETQEAMMKCREALNASEYVIEVTRLQERSAKEHECFGIFNNISSREGMEDGSAIELDANSTKVV